MNNNIIYSYHFSIGKQMNTTHTHTECIPQQIRVFTRWFSNNLAQSNSKVSVSDVTKDLKSGDALLELSKALAGSRAIPKKAPSKAQSSDLAIDIFTKDGVHLKGVTGEEVSANKEKFILGLIWTLIVHYSINKSIRFSLDDSKANSEARFSSKSKVTHATAEKHYKQALVQWAIDRTENYPGVKEFQPFGLSLCALLDSFFPDKINFFALDPSKTERNAQVAIGAMQELDIPVLFELSDIQSTKIDDKALLTQLAVIKISIEKIRPSHATISKSRTLILDDEFNPHREQGNNLRYEGRKFGLIMTLKETDYRNGAQINPQSEQVMFGEDVHLALTLKNENTPYLNSAGRLLDVAKPNIKNDRYQQFQFGFDRWTIVINPIVRKGLVWDVSDKYNLNPPAGTPFYVYTFHGRHNQHFIYKNGMIYAQQNGHVVTYVGGDKPFVMMPPSKTLKARQTFRIQLL